MLGQVHMWAEADLARAEFHLNRARARIESDFILPIKNKQTRQLHQKVLWSLRKVLFDRGAYRESLEVLHAHDQYYEPRLLHLKGWAFLKLGRIERAHLALEQAQEVVDESDPRFPEILDTLGQLHYETGEPARALEYFEQAWLLSEEVSPQPDPAYLTNAGEAARDLGRFEAAEEHWQEAADWSHPYTQAAPLDRLAVLYAGQGRFEEAFEALDRAKRWRSRLVASVAHQTRSAHSYRGGSGAVWPVATVSWRFRPWSGP